MSNNPRGRLSVPGSALAGMLAVAAALGFSHLVAGIIDPASSPFLAVGNSAIDRTPRFAKDFAIQQFGSNDKNVLLLSMAVVILLFGAVAGVLSRRRALPGIVLIGVLGVVGALAIYNRPDTEPYGPVTALVAVLFGVGTLVLLRRVAPVRSRPDDPARAPAAPPGGSHGLSRRGFLGTSAGVAAAAGVAAYAGQRVGSVDIAGSQNAVGTITAAEPLSAVPASAEFVADKGMPFITSNADFYRVDTALNDGPQILADNWSLRVHGMVDREITLNFAQLVDRDLIEQRLTFTCVSYEIGSELVSTADFVGVSLRDLIMEAGPQAGADQLFSTSEDGYTASTPLEAVLAEATGAMLAVNMNGEPLPQVHGFPVRMIVPGFYGYCSATKWLVDLKVTTYAADVAYWTPRGYAERAPVKPGSKISFPRGLSEPVPAGNLSATGVAWAQGSGVAKVEVRYDKGEWVAARLGDDLGPNTWRMWRIDLGDVPAGVHSVECRATNAGGETQVEERVPPLPDGATGWHNVGFRVG